MLQTKVSESQNLVVYIGKLKFQDAESQKHIYPEFLKFQLASMLLLHQDDLNFAHIDIENYAFGEIYAMDGLE